MGTQSGMGEQQRTVNYKRKEYDNLNNKNQCENNRCKRMTNENETQEQLMETRFFKQQKNN